MKPKFLFILLAGWCCSSAFGQSPYASLQVPKQIQYQGRVATAAGGAWSGTEGYFTFALVQGATFLWNNWDGNSNPATNLTSYTNPQSANVLTLPVNQGVFSVRLGDTTLSSTANKEIPATVFFDTTSNAVRANVKLAVWFSPDGGTFTRLSPDVDFTSVPYAMVSGIAETVKERAVTTAMMADGTLVAADLSASLQADSINPPGSVTAFSGSVSPTGWVFCDGSSKLRTDPQFARLFSVIGTTYGAVDGNHFNLPDLRGRVPAGKDGIVNGSLANRLTTAGSGINGNSLGAADGREEITLTAAQSALPSHSHSITDNGHAHGTKVPLNDAGGGSSWIPGRNTLQQTAAIYRSGAESNALTTSSATNTTGITGTNATEAQNASSPHSVTQPTIVLHYIIKL